MTWRMSQHKKVHFVLMKDLMMLRNLGLPEQIGYVQMKGRQRYFPEVAETMSGAQCALHFFHSTWFLQGPGQQSRDS